MTITQTIRKAILFAGFALFGFAANAQVSGTIKDADSGEPLPSVSVKKGRNWVLSLKKKLKKPDVSVSQK